MFELVEPRVLLSADLLGLAGLPGTDLGQEQAPWDIDGVGADTLIADVDAQLRAETADHSVHPPTEPALQSLADLNDSDEFDGNPLADDPLSLHVQAAALSDPATVPSELLIIDPRVPDYQNLVDGITAGRDAGALQIFVLDARRDGIAQISELLGGRENIAAVHIVSHGNDDGLQLGSTWLSGDNLDRYSETLAGWGEALSADADLLLYGCEIAADSDGQALVDLLGELTGADVAASTDPTGSASLGGDWDLEHRSGAVETAVLAPAADADAWQGLLGATAVGGEIPVNEDPLDWAQSTLNATPSPIASDADGNFIVVWESDGQDGNNEGIYARLFNADGAPQGGEFLVNDSVTDGAQTNPAVAMNPDGAYVIVWQTDAYTDPAANKIDIYARLVDKDGNDSGEFRVNAGHTADDQTDPSVTLRDDGSFVVAWTSNKQDGDREGIFAQRFDAAGGVLGGQILVNNLTPDKQLYASIDSNAAGDFAVTWSGKDLTSGKLSVYARVFDADGSPQDKQFVVDQNANRDQQYSDVALLDDGSLVVVWQSRNQDDGSDGIYGRRFDADREPLGDEFLVHVSTPTLDESAPSIAADPAGNFVVTWTGGGSDVYAREFDALGNPVSAGELAVATDATDQYGAGVSMTGPGSFVIAYSGEGGGDSDGVFARRYQSPEPPAIDLNGAAAGGDYSAAFVEGGAPVNIADPAADIAYAAGPNLAKLVVVLTNPLDGAAEVLSADLSDPSLDPSISVDYRDGVLTIAGSGAVPSADLVKVLRTVTYENTSPAPATSDRILRVLAADDSLLFGPSAYATVSVQAVNDAPAVTAPASAITAEDTALPFTAGGSNQIRIGDDAGADDIEVRLDATHGTLSLTNRLGDEFRVNAATPKDQELAAIAVAADGRYVVVWEQHNGLDKEDVYARTYAADGSAISGDILVNDDTGARQGSADVAIDANGNFVVVWEHDTENVNDKDDIHARTFDIDGAAYGNAIRVNAEKLDDQLAPSVAMDPDGYFVVAWQSKTAADGKEIYLRPFDIYLNALVGEDILVNTTPGSDQTNPDVAVKADGEFVVVWQSKDQDGSGEGIYLRRFDAAGDALDAAETLVNATTTANHQTVPSVAINDAGQTVIAWQSKGQDNPDNKEGIYTQRYDFDSAALVGGEIAVTTETDDDQKAPAVAISSNGNFVVAWQSKDQDDDDGREGVYLQEFAADGSRLRFETLVNTHTLDAQTAPAIGMAGVSQYVVVWQSQDQDPDGSDGIYGQRFLQPGALDFTLGDGIDDGAIAFRGRVDNINAALSNLRFSPEANYYGPAALDITVDDLGHTGSGGAYTVAHSVAITVEPINDPPQLQTPQGIQQVAETVPFTFDAFNGTLIRLSDIDSDAGAPPDLELSLSVAHGTLSADVAGSGVSVTAGANDSAGMSLRGTQAQLNAAIDGLVYTPDLAHLGADTLSLSVDDLGNFGAGGPALTTESVAINVFDYNVPPVNQYPATVATPEDAPFDFNGANRLEVIDHDADPDDDIDVTLTVTHGLLSLSANPGIAISGDWLAGDATLILDGDKSLVNAALDGLRFTPDPHFAGTATLQMTTGDQGNSGIDGIKTDQDIIAIQVTPDAINDAPTISTPATVDTTEETPFVFTSVSGNPIRINDDADDQPIRVKLTAADGTISLSTTVGTQFQVNSNTADQQNNAAAAMTPDGGFVLVWQSNNQDDDGYGIFAQRYDADGTALAAEFKVNTVFHKHQTDPAVAVADDGSFVVVWVGEDQDGSNKGIFGQRFNADGERTGAEFQVNTYVTKAQISPDVAMDASGRFVVVWASDDQDGDDYGVYGQLFDAGGAKSGPEFQINLTTARHQQAPAVAMDEDGDFVVVWQSEVAGDNKWDIHARRFDAAGVAKDAAEIPVNSVTDQTQLAPDVAMDATGNFVVVWQSKDLDYPDGEFGIYQRCFDADGSALTAKQTLVNTQVAKDQSAATVAMDRAGAYVIAWQGENQDDPDHRFGVFAQRYAADGEALGGEFRANTTTVKDQRAPAVAAGDAGRFVIAWESDGEDGSGYGVFGQLYQDVDGLNFLQGDGRDDAVVEFEAPLDEVNDVLDGLSFTPAVDFDGTTTLSVEVDDLGHSGGPAQLSSAVTTINVSPLNDAPTFSLPTPQRAYEDVPLVFSAANGNAVRVEDVDAGSSPISVHLSAYGGELSLAGITGLTFSLGDGSDDAVMRFSGSQASINDALDGLEFRAAPGFAGAGSIQISADDGGYSGDGGAKSNAAGIVVNVESDLVNDAPAIQVPGPQQTGKNVELRLSDLDGNPIVIEDDALDQPIRVQLSVVNGSISLSDGLGPETPVNTTTAGEQRFSDIAATSSGSHVLVWQSKGQDEADSEGIYAQRFAPDGSSVGFEIAVNQFVAGDQTAPVVAASPSGEFAVAWVSNGQDGSGLGVFARKFDAYGNAISAELLVNTGVIGNQTAPAIAMDGNGGFVVVWEGPGDGDDLFLQRFDRYGVAVGAETRVNTTMSGNQELASVAMDDDGNFIVVWQAADDNGLGIFAQRFDAAGQPVGVTEFAVNTVEDNGDQVLAVVAMNASGQFAIAWQGEDGNNAGIRASLFAADGTPLREDFVVNAFEDDDQTAPAVAIAADGGFVVSWQSNDNDSQGVYARYFDAAGDPISGDLTVNLTTAGDQVAPAVAVDPDGAAIVTWTSDNQDGDKEGIYVQRLIPAGAVTWHVGTGDLDALVDVEATPEQINGLLNGLIFTPNNNFEGEARIDIVVDDQGNSGSGGPLGASDRVTIMVNAPRLDLDGDDSSGADGADYLAHFTPGGAAIAVVDDDFVIATPESELDSVTLVLTNRPDGAAEGLSVDTGAYLNIDHDPYDAGTGELRIYGRGLIAHYQTVLDSVRYHNGAATPDGADRRITVQFEDHAGDVSNSAVATIRIDKQPPVLTLNGELDYTEGDPAGLVVSSVTIVDPDTGYFAAGRLSVDMASSGSADDRLAIEGQAGAVGEITLSGSDVSYNFGGVTGTRVIGTLAAAGPYDGLTPLIVDLTSDADAASVEALIERISYENVSDSPATNLRAIRFVLEDGEGGVSETASATVRVTDVPAAVAAAEDSFDYAAGGLAGAAGGYGWSGAWQDGNGIDGDGEVASASVAEPSGSLFSVGGHAVLIDGVVEPVAYRNLSDSLGADGTDAWVGFVLRPDSPASFADGNYGGLVLGGGVEDGSGGLFIGHQSGNVGLMTAGSGSGAYVSGLTAAEDAPLFLVAHIEFRPGDDVVTLYANPTPGAEPGAGFDPGRIAVKTDLDLGSFTQLALVAGDAAQQSFDEIRIADSFAAVAPVSAPNAAPVVDAGQTFSISETAAVNDPVGIATGSDPDPTDVLQNWAIVSGNDDGVFQIDPASGAIRIADTTHLDHESTASYSLGIRVSDGVSTSATETVEIIIDDVNDRPDQSGSYDLGFTPRGVTSQGVTVATVLSGISASDPDGDTLGLAVFSAGGLGGWEYSVDSSDGFDGVWTAFGPVNPNAALLLDEGTWIRYVPSGATAETAMLDFRAWDQTAGSASLAGNPSHGDTVSPDPTGAFGSGSASAVLTVSLTAAADDAYGTAENDLLTVAAPGVLDNDRVEGAAGVTPGATLDYLAWEDVDGNGVWEDQTGVAGYDVDFGAATVVRDTALSGAPAGISAAFVFDGSGGGEFAELMEDLPGDPTVAPASLEFWFRPSDAVGSEILFDTGSATDALGHDGASLRLNGSILEWSVWNDGTANLLTVSQDIAGEIAAGEFVHVVAAFDPVTTHAASLRVNGGAATTAANAAIDDWASLSAPTGLGQVGGTGTITAAPAGADPFEGEIAGFRLYGFELSDAQVQTNYDAMRLNVVAHDASSAAGAAVTVNPDGSFNYDPGSLFESLSAGQTAVDGFGYTVEDASGTQDTATVSVTVTGTNDDPTDISLSAGSVNQSGGADALVGSLSASDVDGADSHSFTLVAGAGDTDNALFKIVSDQLRASDAGAMAPGSYSVRVQADDGHGGSTEKAFAITVSDDVAPGALVDADATANQVIEGTATGATVGLTVHSSDTPATSVHYFLTNDAGGRFTIDTDSGVVTVADGSLIDHEIAASHSITVVATDAAGNGRSQSFAITVGNVAPSANADSAGTGENASLSVAAAGGVLANDTDPNGFDGEARVAAVNGAAGNVGGSVAGSAGGSFRVYADGGFDFDPGSDFDDLAAGETRATEVRYTLSDGAATDTATLTVTVNGANDLPVLLNGALQLTKGETVELDLSNLSASDADHAAADLVFQVSDVAGGHFALKSDPEAAITQFTQGQVAVGEVIFVDNGDGTAPAFKVRVTDGSATTAEVAAFVDFTVPTEPTPEPDPDTGTDSGSDPDAGTEPDPEETETGDGDGDEKAVADVDDYLVPSSDAGAGSVSPAVKPEAEDIEQDAGAQIATEQGDYRPEFRIDRVAASVAEALRADWFNAGEYLLDTFRRTEQFKQFELLIGSDDFQDNLDKVRNRFEDLRFLDQTVLGSSVAASTGLSVGYVAWLLRGGVLLSTVLSSMPAWNLVDPLPVLASTRKADSEEDDDSLEDIIKKPQGAADDKEVTPERS